MFLFDNHSEITPSETDLNMWLLDESVYIAFFRAASLEVWENKSLKASLNEHLKTVIRVLSVATPVSRYASVALPLARLIKQND